MLYKVKNKRQIVVWEALHNYTEIGIFFWAATAFKTAPQLERLSTMRVLNVQEFYWRGL